VILTRSDPPLPLARLRAHDDLYELHAADLRFSLEEIQTFLRQALPFPLDTSAIARLEARTEGWVAGLRLLALALQGRKDPQDFEHVLATFTGTFWSTLLLTCSLPSRNRCRSFCCRRLFSTA
jgi:LuxR family maltose regulon positive regulatory protein